MKFTATAATIALLASPLVQALPSNFVQSIAAGALPVRDVAVLAELEASHNETLAELRAGHFTALGEPGSDSDIEKRNPLAMAGYGGMFLITKLGGETVKRIGSNIRKALKFETDEIWFSEKRCRVSFRTQGGGNQGVWSYDKGYGYNSPSGTHEFHAPWVDSAPPVHYYHDTGIGHFSVQFTATDKYAWSGIEGTKKCGFQGLCNPQLVFYRDGYNIAINTWDSQGSKAECYYSNGERCGGLCKSGVKNQFASGGAKWAGDCAIPCYSEGQP
ncbi:hypothetical protein Micbo1qcDRAFT_201803 [Microdochium bolleyi]|uniref:Uncharacterized protein n=1 Tax=Microdochium bolleyi TaxID=196109 RepID=A0A136J9X8_9PEZI|nr:hypothetical protein Micbo1qcDRAFT_201803 [Microdochium bolleyi]